MNIHIDKDIDIHFTVRNSYSIENKTNLCVFICRNRPAQEDQHHISVERSPVFSKQMIISHHSQNSDPLEHITWRVSNLRGLFEWNCRDNFYCHPLQEDLLVQRPHQSNSSLSEQVTGSQEREDTLRFWVSFAWQQQALNCSKMILKVPKWVSFVSVWFSPVVRKTNVSCPVWQVRRTASSHCKEGTTGAVRIWRCITQGINPAFLSCFYKLHSFYWHL